jgi:hypothetical protein
MKILDKVELLNALKDQAQQVISEKFGEEFRLKHHAASEFPKRFWTIENMNHTFSRRVCESAIKNGFVVYFSITSNDELSIERCVHSLRTLILNIAKADHQSIEATKTKMIVVEYNSKIRHSVLSSKS